MAYFPIAFIAPNYRDYNDYWLKAYGPGTTTPKVMALDSAASVTVAKLQLNADGFLKSAGGALVIPYLSGAYDLYLFPTEAEADSNTTANAVRVADNINASGSGGELSQAYEFDTVELMTDSTIVFPVGKRLHVKNRVSFQLGGGGDFIVNQIPTVSNPYGSLALLDGKVAILQDVVEGQSDVKQYGALGNDAADDTGAINAAHAVNDNVYFPKTSGAYRASSITLNDRAKFKTNGALLRGTTTGSLLIITDAVGASRDRIEIEGFQLDTTQNGSGVAINVGTNIRRVYIRNNRIEQFNKGIQLSGAYSSDISFNEIRNNATGIEIQSKCHALTLINNLVHDNTARGLSFINGDTRDVTIVGGAYQGSPIGIFADSVESLTILGDVYYETNTIADVKLINCYAAKIFSGDSSSLVSEASIVYDGCAGNCRIQGMTYAATTNSTPFHIMIKGVNGNTVIEDLTAAAGQTSPIDTSGATNAKNVSIGSINKYALNASNKGNAWGLTAEGVNEWSQELTNIGTTSSRTTLEHVSTTGRDYRINTSGIFRLYSNNQAAEYLQYNLGVGNPTLAIKGNFSNFDAYDGLYSNGTALARWSEVFAVTGTINTSDERQKTPLEDISDIEKLVAREIQANIKKYKWLSSVEIKGDKARYHIGVGAQTVKAIFESHGLDGFDYAVLCYNEWDDQFEDIIELNEDGSPVLDEIGSPKVSGQKLVKKAGDAYGIRPDQLNMFMLSALL